MGLFDKMWQALAGEQQQQQRPPPTTAPVQPHPFGVILAHQHPASMMLPIKGTFADGGHWVMHLGATDTHWMTTSPNGHALALAAPQSHAGKTSSFMIPPILSTFDRVVATTTKPDMVRATALARRRAGDRGGPTWFSRRLPISRSRT